MNKLLLSVLALLTLASPAIAGDKYPVFVESKAVNDKPVVAVSNFAPVPRHGYVLPLPQSGRWLERINTDANQYGGSGKGNFGVIMAENQASHGQPASARLTLPPLATLILESEG